ncbi:branched-chain alpha-keto acid dehydrogenase subunit E2 [Streptomyces dioscori]|uniref:Dihydrolipoamide acetyltransferase component of pyruvate dehydrogenase complex n=1 Tax=Streptomyces dioscori TaxID=2109333 RepID=A0A2P8QGF9_9ACTN|nr:branched-chain alpha-keto acid dehydrogenase subunit E2 [Streptomyces dioscori]
MLLPDVGEGLTEADIVTWHVAVGDTVTVNQVIVDIETAKSVVELPSSYAGEVVELLAAEGETAAVGSPIIAIRTNEAPPASPEGGHVPGPPESAGTEGDSEPRLLVGYGARDSGHRPRRRTPAATVTGPAAGPVTEAAEPTNAQLPSETAESAKPRAKPPVRKLAKDLGVDLATVSPTGPDGTVRRDDVLRASQQRTALSAGAAAPGVPAYGALAPGVPTSNDPVPDVPSPGVPAAHARGPLAVESRIAIKGVRKHTAAAMVASAFTAPHVTEFVTVDVTRTLELRDLVQHRREFRETKLSPLAFVARAYLRALRRTPTAAARWDEAAQEIVVPAGVNLGIAAATPRGLMVPNIRNAHLMGLQELAAAINDLAVTARAGKTAPHALTGGNTTITNVGVFGVDTGTPILNLGETAILAVGAVRRRPWVVEDHAGERIEARSVLQLALSFDHRVIDGQEGSQLLADTAALLAEPGLAVL